jgi:hypothetical protein
MPEARRRAPFELLRFSVVPTGADVAVVELEGRFPRGRERFVRRPVLVIEGIDGERTEIPAVWSSLDGVRWSGIFAVPDMPLEDVTFALGVRGTLLDLPEPDRAPDSDRVAALAREANQLRRRVEAAEERAAGVEAEADERAASAEAAADERARAAQAEAQERATSAEAAADERARAAQAEADERIAAADERVRAVQADAEERATAAGAAAAERAEQAEAAAAARVEEAQSGVTGRVEAVESELTQRLWDAEERATAAEDRATAAEQALGAAEAGLDVLRAELAEERERAHQAIAELLERLGEASGHEDATRRLSSVRAESPDAGEEATAVVPPVRRRPAVTMPTAPQPPDPTASRAPVGADGAAGGMSRWIAVGALVLAAVTLIGLLFGFLG